MLCAIGPRKPTGRRPRALGLINAVAEETPGRIDALIFVYSVFYTGSLRYPTAFATVGRAQRILNSTYKSDFQ